MRRAVGGLRVAHLPYNASEPIANATQAGSSPDIRLYYQVAANRLPRTTGCIGLGGAGERKARYDYP